MKQTGMKTLRSGVSLLLVLCMIFGIMPTTAMAAGNGHAEQPIVYVSIGDSMTNGYCLDGYDGTSGAVNYGIETYGNKFAAWLAGYTGPISNDQVIFKGTNGTVDHRQLSISGLRAQDIHWILEMDYTNESLMQTIFNMDYNGTGWNADTWYNTLGLYGDRYTWGEYGDYDYRYADAAARILAMYYGGNGTGYFTSSYTDEVTVQNAIAGIAANPYYPEGKAQANEMGGYKYLQVATEFYQKSMADADIISLAVGNTNFGTHMLSNITDVIMSNDKSFSSQYSIDQAMELAAKDPFAQKKVNEMLGSEDFAEIVGACTYLAGKDDAKAAEIAYIVKYCMISFITGYIGMVNSILELNPDAQIIQIALMNAYEEKNGTVASQTLGELVDIIYTPVNQFLKDLPANLMASKTAEDQATYADAKFFFAEADYVSCMVDVFGDDYYSKDGSFVEYPGLLTGTEGYSANTSSIVRNRFVEEIICGDMIFNAMGLKKQKTQQNMNNFLWGGDVYKADGSMAYNGIGAVAYDMMTLTEKAAYAAQNANAAKEYALYLAFENSLIRSGTKNVTMDALAGLSNIQSAFAAFYPEVLAAIGNARANYYEAVAPVIVAGSNDALTEARVVEIMAAFEQVKAAVWNGFAEYHEALKAATGHTTIEHVINCDTCMSSGGHGDGISGQIVAVYNEQMDLLPYTIVAETIKDQTNGLLGGEDVRTLCKTEDTAAYEAAVYDLVIAKAAAMKYTFTAEDVDLLLEEDGEFKIAAKIANAANNTSYTADQVKMAYEMNIMLTAEQRSGIEMLGKVRAGVLMLLDGETEGNLKNGAAGIRSAIDGAAQLAYLLALPQAMSDTLYGNSNMQGALCMNARCLLGTGAGGHPSVGGHTALYNAVMSAYVHVTYEWSEDHTSCTAYLNGRFPADATVTSEVTTPATCKTEGTTTYTATFDVTWAETQTKSVNDISTSDHSFGEWVETTKPTCTEAGEETRTCTTSGCDAKETRTVDARHNYEAVVTDPTCTEGGYTTYTCACGDTYTADETAATGHSFGEWVIDPAADCTNTGLKTRTCACGEKETEEIPATNHNYNMDEPAWIWAQSEDGTVRASVSVVCTADATHVLSADATVVEASRTNPTCSEDGMVVYTATATLNDQEFTAEKSYTLTATGHSYGEDGKCTACGEADPDAHPVCEYTVAETLTSGNTYILSLGGTQVGSYTFVQVSGGWAIQASDGTYLAIADKALTNSSDAFAWTFSDNQFSAEITTSSGSSNNWWGNIFGNWWGSSSSSTTTYYLVASGSGVAISESNSKANAAFYTAHSDASHAFNNGVVTAPTCTKDGYTTYTCERCGYSYTGNVVPSTGHHHTASVTAPTCTENGYTTYTCACGDSYVADYVDALGHDMVDGTCTKCGYSENVPEEPEKPDVPDEPEIPEEGNCSYLEAVSLRNGQLILTLGGQQMGTFTFSSGSNDTWNIQAADGLYLALANESLTYSADPFAWTWSNNRFSAKTQGNSSNSGWGGFFGNWWGSGSNTTYYLVASGNSVSVSTSTSSASAAFYVNVTGEHAYGDPTANNGTHVYTCGNCGNVKTVVCNDDNCELCHPVVPDASVSVDVKITSSSSSGSNWWDRFFGSSEKTYTATITVAAEGTEVKSVAYSTNGGSSWTEGTSFTSSSNITAFDIRVTATNGVTYYFTYANGTVTAVG